MPDISEQRKLAAIMFTDMVGYSALSQRNDKFASTLVSAKTMSLWLEHALEDRDGSKSIRYLSNSAAIRVSRRSLKGS
jgi:hypothetical protein